MELEMELEKEAIDLLDAWGGDDSKAHTRNTKAIFRESQTRAVANLFETS